MSNILILIALITSGLISSLASNNTQQLTLLIHSLLAFLLLTKIIIDTKSHIKEKQSVLSHLMIITGLISILLLALSYISAIANIIFHTAEYSGILTTTHQFSSYILILVLFSHLLPKYNYIRNQILIFKINFKSVAVILTFMGVILLAGYVLLFTLKPHYSIDAYSYAYGENPFSPSLTVTEDQKFIHPSYFDNSSCIGCHKGIAKQWQSSAHRHSAADPFYVKNVNLLSDLKGIEATRYCEGCHAPGALLSGALTPGGTHGGQQESIANNIGVDCVTCHSIDSSTNDEGNANYVITEKRLGLISALNDKPLDFISIASISLSARSHTNMMRNDFTSTAQYCATCHAQFMDESMNDWGWVKMQDEYQAWLDSPLSHGNDPAFSKENALTCQNCHMPLIKADDPAANAEGLVKSHKFLGANTALPFLRNDTSHLLDTVEFLSSNKLSMSFDIPNRKKAIESSLHSNRVSKSHDIKPIYFYSGENIEANLIISNHGVGHNFPGGSIDLNEAWVEIEIRDATGMVLYRIGGLDVDGFLSLDSYVYKSIPVDPSGNPVWKHDLFNKTGEAYKNVIKAGESDSIPITAYIPHQAESPLILTAKLRYRKLNKKYSDWALGNTKTVFPIVDVSHTELTVDLVQRPPTVE
jgi:hypothetical protein